MKELKKKAFKEIDDNFLIMLESKENKSYDFTNTMHTIIDAQISLLHVMSIITLQQCEFLSEAINYVWLDKGVK